MDPYKYVNNLGRDITSYDIDQEFPLKIKAGKCFNEKKLNFIDLPDILKYICVTGSISLNKLDYLLINPDVICERRHHTFDKKYNYSKDNGSLAIHSDRDGPPGGKKCYTIIFYYKIDCQITNSCLDFYEYKDGVDGKCYLSDKELYKKTASLPLKTGDIIAFDDDILHCPSDYGTTSDKPVTRGLISIFILL